MLSSMRTIIDIPAGLLEDIDAVARADNISRAEAIRRAMAAYLEKRKTPRTDAAFGIWRSRKVDALAYEDELRSEWGR